KERRPAFIKHTQYGACRMRERAVRRVRRWGQRPPDRPPLPSKQRDGRRANGTGLSVPRSAFRVPSYAESPPRDLPREAEPVEPQRVVLPHPGGQDVGLPRARRQLEAVQQLEHGGEPLRPFGSRIFGDPLPAEQEAHEVGGRDRLDLPTQAVERVAVDAREQPPLAPLELGGARGKPAPQHETLVLESAQGEVDVGHRDAERAPQLGRRRRAHGLESPAHQLTYRVLAGPARGAL